ncbi:hypothetical protein [Streptomyces axinellae]|uniref:Uncharacterized protein n=1 Tax=Streptomyces axinellae TaxID=552788 RepID=A0ABN3Q6W4_9ACTN
MSGLKIVLRELGRSRERRAAEAGVDAGHGRSAPSPWEQHCDERSGAPKSGAHERGSFA